MMKINGVEVDTRGCQTALDVMIKNGFDVDYECRDGVCGACRCKFKGKPIKIREMIGFYTAGETLVCSVSALSDIDIYI